MNGKGFRLGIRQIKRVRVGHVILRRRSNDKTTAVVSVSFLYVLVPLTCPVAEATAHDPLTQAG